MMELQSPTAGPCVTLIFSIDPEAFANKSTLHKYLKKELEGFEKTLRDQMDEKLVRHFIQSLNFLVQRVQLNGQQKGIGFYLAPGFRRLVSFSFKVNGKMTISNSFDLIEAEKMLKRMADYAALLMSKKSSRLLIGNGRHLTEVVNGDFPEHFEDEFQVHRASPFSFYNREESKIDQARLDDFFRRIDRKLYAEVDSNPVVLLGVSKHLSSFKSVMKHPYRIVTEVIGNFDHHKPHEISEIIWPAVESYLEKNNT